MGMNAIIPGVFLGDSVASRDLTLLEKNGITHILVIGDRLPLHFPKKFKYHQIPVEDNETTNLLVHFETCNEFILSGLQSGGNVFVHCLAGISRSSSVIIAYLMCQHKWTYDKAFKHTEKQRPFIYPNHGFRQQLRLLEVMKHEVNLKHPDYLQYLDVLKNPPKKE